MALGFAGSIGRGPIELDCHSALSYYKNVIENQAIQAAGVGVGCLTGGECHSRMHGSAEHWIMLPRALEASDDDQVCLLLHVTSI